MPDLSFRITSPGKPVQEVPIQVGLSFGRRPENTIQLEDSKASGRHAHVVEVGGQLVLEDLGSSNHTHVLGADAKSLKGGESHPLTSGTIFQIGETKLVVIASGGADDDRTIAAQALSTGEGPAGLAMLAAFKAARPRLTISNEAIRTIQDIDKANFLVGRDAESAQLVIEHKAVSTAHAAITFEDKRFYLEDLGSSNGTFLNGDRLPPNQKVELKPESHVRFGSIDALFVTDADAEGRPSEERRYLNAIEVLIADGDVPASQRDEAIREARDTNRHAGEVLLNQGMISVGTWITAWRKAEFYVPSRSASSGGGGGGSSKLLIGIIVVLALAVVGLLLWQLKVI